MEGRQTLTSRSRIEVCFDIIYVVKLFLSIMALWLCFPFPSISWSNAHSVDHSTFPKLLANANLTHAIHQSRAFDEGNPSSDSTYLPVHC